MQFSMPTIAQDKRPPYVMFNWKAIPNPQKTEAEGRVVYDNVAYVSVIAHGSKDVYEKAADEWFTQKRREAMQGFYPSDWLDLFTHQYQQWQKGVETPRDGTPLVQWPIARPADVAQCAQAMIVTVEDLAEANETALQMLGMGGRQLRDKARNWLEAAKDRGTLVETVSKLQADNADMRSAMEESAKKIAELESALAGKKTLTLKREAQSP